MKKILELMDPRSCLNKARLDEPIFVLRAKDKLTPAVVGLWAEQAAGVHEEAKVKDAQSFCLAAAEWFRYFRRDHEAPSTLPVWSPLCSNCNGLGWSVTKQCACAVHLPVYLVEEYVVKGTRDDHQRIYNAAAKGFMREANNLPRL